MSVDQFFRALHLGQQRLVPTGHRKRRRRVVFVERGSGRGGEFGGEGFGVWKGEQCVRNKKKRYRNTRRYCKHRRTDRATLTKN